MDDALESLSRGMFRNMQAASAGMSVLYCAYSTDIGRSGWEVVNVEMLKYDGRKG